MSLSSLSDCAVLRFLHLHTEEVKSPADDYILRMEQRYGESGLTRDEIEDE